jgi:hypothetical protein
MMSLLRLVSDSSVKHVNLSIVSADTWKPLTARCLRWGQWDCTAITTWFIRELWHVQLNEYRLEQLRRPENINLWLRTCRGPEISAHETALYYKLADHT